MTPQYTTENVHASHQQARFAHKKRGQLLTLLAQGKTTLQDTIRIAQTDPHLKKIRLDHLLNAAGYKPATITRILTELTRLTKTTTAPPKHPTISWLTDPKTHNRRILALATTLAEPRAKTDTPWDGYPATPIPENYTREANKWL